MLYESNELSKEARDTAALLVSKVYYFLEEYDEALSFALGAGAAFENESRTFGSEEYIETIVCEWHSNRVLQAPVLTLCLAKAIDRYVELRSEEVQSKPTKVDNRLQDIIEGIFRRCIEDGEHKQVYHSLLSLSPAQLVHSTYRQ